MSRTKKLALGAATLWPLAYSFLFFAFFVLASRWIMSVDAAARGNRMRSLLGVFFALHVFTTIWIFVLVAIYIWMLFMTDRVPQDKKALWAVVRGKYKKREEEKRICERIWIFVLVAIYIWMLFNLVPA